MAPFWMDSAAFPEFGRLDEDVTTDVIVVGGGITGLTAACLLASEGRAVTVLERDRCARIDTGHTSAHLTMVTDVRLRELEKAFGRTHAQAAWDAGLAAIAQIDELIRQHDIDAGFEWVPGYLHVASDRAAADAEIDELRHEAQLATELGFDVAFVEAVPVFNVPGLRFDDQARFHPRKYLAGLANAFLAAGGRIFEHSAASEFCDEPRWVKANGHTVRCEEIVVATHNPLVGLDGLASATMFQTKLALYSSYVVAGRVPRESIPDALWWDTADPYRYLRLEPHADHDLLILGGEDHKTGQDAAEGRYERLEAEMKRLVPGVDLSHRWSGQVIETGDGLPYIGRSAAHQYSATGFAGNGMTFGTLSGMMIADAIAGRSNPWAELFAPDRKVRLRALWDYARENADYPYYLIRDRFAGRRGRTLRSVRRGHGAILDHEGKKVAAYRDRSGAVTLRSATCTHMGCLVAWNSVERTWDCPCHGSRFAPTGEVISGPAESPLAAVGE